MPTLLLRLEGPMQSWGGRSHFDLRDSGQEPTKSGVLGLISAALGTDRHDGSRMHALTALRMGVRIDRPGVLRQDYQTAHLFEDVTKPPRTAQTWREYLADASFLVGLEGQGRGLLAEVHAALANPTWLLCLGRQAYSPTSPVFLQDGLREETLEEALRHWPLTERSALPVSMVCETSDTGGERRQDVPLGAFAERRFGSRSVCRAICIPKESP